MANTLLGTATDDTLSSVPTPAVLVCVDRLERNLARMQAVADREAVRLRPHVKTHKSVELARRQLELGATGITVAKVGEAEVFVDHGIGDVRVAYPLVQEQQLARLARLQRRGAQVSFLVDSRQGAEVAARAFADAGLIGDALIKVDCGYGRVGVPWEAPALTELSRFVDAQPSLELRGVLTHAGQSYDGPEGEEPATAALERYALLERDRLVEAARRVQAERRARGEGERPLEISVGSTPTLSAFRNLPRDEPIRVTEVRPGNYVFNDLTQVALGVAELDDCALTVLATVVSDQEDAEGRRLVVDAGRKVLTSDLRYGSDGYGQLLDGLTGRRPAPDSRLPKISEEHLQVRGASADLRIGDRVRIVPNHACVVVNTQDSLCLEQSGRGLRRLRVDARGRSS